MPTEQHFWPSHVVTSSSPLQMHTHLALHSDWMWNFFLHTSLFLQREILLLEHDDRSGVMAAAAASTREGRFCWSWQRWVNAFLGRAIHPLPSWGPVRLYQEIGTLWVGLAFVLFVHWVSLSDFQFPGRLVTTWFSYREVWGDRSSSSRIATGSGKKNGGKCSHFARRFLFVSINF